MTLGEIIKEFRESQSMSQRKFAEISGLSNSYISMLEQNMNSKNGKPIKPTLEALKAVADALHVPLDDVLVRLDDIEINISGKPTADQGDELDNRIMMLVRQLPEELKLSLLDVLQAAVAGARVK